MSAALFQIFTLRRRPIVGRLVESVTFAFKIFLSGSESDVIMDGFFRETREERIDKKFTCTQLYHFP